MHTEITPNLATCHRLLYSLHPNDLYLCRTNYHIKLPHSSTSMSILQNNQFSNFHFPQIPNSQFTHLQSKVMWVLGFWMSGGFVITHNGICIISMQDPMVWKHQDRWKSYCQSSTSDGGEMESQDVTTRARDLIISDDSESRAHTYSRKF